MFDCCCCCCRMNLLASLSICLMQSTFSISCFGTCSPKKWEDTFAKYLHSTQFIPVLILCSLCWNDHLHSSSAWLYQLWSLSFEHSLRHTLSWFCVLWIVQVEIADCMQTLFRGNSLASKIMAYCFKIYGHSYLRELLNSLIVDMFAADRQGISYEVDPARWGCLLIYISTEAFW